jgi:hypothetical protein
VVFKMLMVASKPTIGVYVFGHCLSLDNKIGNKSIIFYWNDENFSQKMQKCQKEHVDGVIGNKSIIFYL